MKLTFEQFVELVENISLINGKLILYHFPKIQLNQPKKLYELYYGGPSKIEIMTKSYVIDNEFVTFTSENKESSLKQIYNVIKNNILLEMNEVLNELDWNSEIKYFDKPEEQENYNLFKTKVLEKYENKFKK